MRWLLVIIAGVVGCDSEVEPPLPPPPRDPPPTWGVPISGGTMLVTRDGRHAVIADPDRDRIVTVELARQVVVAELALRADDEPGRLAEDDAGRIHVVLRRGGALVTLAGPAAGAVAARRAVCSEPRGIAYDGATDQLHVACTSGELVSFAASGGEATRRLQLDRDLRDVVVSGRALMVTRFRTAEILTVDAEGTVADRAVPPTVKRPRFDAQGTMTTEAVPAVAWRAVAMSGGRMAMLHQRQRPTQLGMTFGGYSDTCAGQGLVESALTVVQPAAAPFAVAPFAGPVPVDVAVSARGDVAACSAGDGLCYVVDAAAAASPDPETCQGGVATVVGDQLGAPSSVAYTPDGALLIYYPEAPALAVHPAPLASQDSDIIALPGGFGYDAGRALFHTATQARIACASCHPEGRDDGLVWTFEQIGPRRTQSLAGGILRRAPYHWSADLADLDALLDDVFGTRMAGRPITRNQRLSLGPWLDRIPAPAAVPVRDPEALARGQQLFASTELACASCHAGALFTTNQRVDVGTGGTFKVPSLLGVGARAPYMHDGCAVALADRFGACGGDRHGQTSTLTAAQRADLIAYLESL